MASTKDEATKVVNPIVDGGDHDRVAMLSLKADGSPDQHNPEIVGDKDAAVEAAKRQFAEQAVAAVDAAKRDEILGTAAATDGGTEDAAIDKLKAEHDKAAAAAEKRAESTVNSLHQG